MNNIYIVDLIGTYCGCNYYDDSFAEKLSSQGYKVEILSTYNHDNKKPFLPVVFGKNKIVALFTLIYAYVKYIIFVLFHRKSLFIYITYGEFYDLLFLTSSWFCKKVVADVHEVHALKYKDESRISKIFNWFYVSFLHCIIYHSDRTFNTLKTAGYKKDMLYVPHFKYQVKKTYEEDNLSTEINNVFTTTAKIKFLFFGNLSYVKGIDVVCQYFENLREEFRSEVELVIAGKNVENIDFSSLRKYDNYHVFDRHINDDELVYLYAHTDYVLLPYRKSSQSGIFEMATCFRKPMLLTDIPYFHSMITRFPSFGVESSIDKYNSLIDNVIKNHGRPQYYNQKDCDMNDMKIEINTFLKEFNLKFS